MLNTAGSHLFSSFGNVFIHYWIVFAVVYFLFVKDCLEILMWSSIKIKRRFVWILQKLYVDDLWQAVLQEAQNEHSEPLFSKCSVTESSTVPQNPIIKKNSAQRARKRSEIYTYICPSCRSMNKPFLKNVDLRSPFQKGKSFLTHENSTQNIGFSHAQNRYLNTELSECQNASSNTKTMGSVECRNALNADLKTQYFFPYIRKQNGLKSHDVIARLPEYQNSRFVNDQKCDNMIQQSFNFQTTTRYDITQGNAEETIPKEVEITTPPKKSASVSAVLETPVCEVKVNPRKSRLELEFSSETHIPNLLPEEQSFLKRSWNKWKNSHQVDKTCDQWKSSTKENSVTSNGLFSTIKEAENAESKRFLVKESPMVNNCCSNMLLKLKTKFYPRDTNATSVSFKRF